MTRSQKILNAIPNGPVYFPRYFSKKCTHCGEIFPMNAHICYLCNGGLTCVATWIADLELPENLSDLMMLARSLGQLKVGWEPDWDAAGMFTARVNGRLSESAVSFNEAILTSLEKRLEIANDRI